MPIQSYMYSVYYENTLDLDENHAIGSSKKFIF